MSFGLGLLRDATFFFCRVISFLYTSKLSKTEAEKGNGFYLWTAHEEARKDLLQFVHLSHADNESIYR